MATGGVRGKSGARGSGFYGNSETSGHVHEDEFYSQASAEQKFDYLMEDLDLNYDEAEVMIDAFNKFTGGSYESIRRAQNDNMPGPMFDVGEQLESYIQQAPKYYGQGAIYRGIDVNNSVAQNIIDTLSNGGTIDMRGTASWSSSLKTAKSFANVGYQSGTSNKSLIFVLPEGTKMGASIQHLSRFGKSESEVLVSKLARYKATSIEMDPDQKYYLIHVTESMR